MAKRPSKRDSDRAKGRAQKQREKAKQKAEAKAKREAEKKRRIAEREKEKIKKQREAQRKKREKEELKRAEEEKKKLDGKRGGLFRPKPKPPKPKPPKPKPPIKGDDTSGPKALSDLFGDKFVAKDKMILADTMQIGTQSVASGKLGVIAGDLTQLHTRPGLAANNWRADDRVIRNNKKIAKAQDAIAQLRSDIPLMLIPLRLETRFTSTAPYALQLRVFPDQIALDGLERRLSKPEIELGNEFLEKYESTSSLEEKQGLWAAFCANGDPWRSAWIVRCLKSGKFGKRKIGESDGPAQAPLLPDCWLVTGKASGEVFHAAGNPIPPDLAFSPDLSPEITPKGDLSIDPAVNWMVDFKEAVRKGMAMEIPLPDKAQDQIDELFVVGVKTQGPSKDHKPLPAAKASEMFEKLLEAHNYDWGGGFVPAGTATNNTSSVRTDWSFNKPDIEALRVRELEKSDGELTIPNIADDGDRALRPIDGLYASDGADTMFDQAKRAFGLKDTSVLGRFEHRQGSERAAARAMNRLLWPVTIGEMFKELLHGPDTNAVKPEVTEFLRSWFCEDLTGGNALPALRSAATTYGVLPIESFTRRGAIHQSTLQGREREELGRRLRALLPEWQDAVPNVLRLAERPDELEGFETPTDRYLGMLKQDSSPADYGVNNIWNLRGLPQIFYGLGETKVHPKHNPHDVEKAFEDKRKLRFTLDVKKDMKFPVAISLPKVAVSFQADRLLADLWSAQGFTHYREWPQAFRDGAHQEQILREKIALLEATLDLNSGIYEHTVKLPVTGFTPIECTIPKSLLFEELAGRVETHIRTILDVLNVMLKFVTDHKLDNSQFVQAFEPPEEIYKGVVGDQDIDARLSYLAFYETTQWPGEKLVEVDAEDETVTPETYLTELADYAKSQRLDQAVPAGTQFPNYDIPLLYSLLRQSVTRVATAPDKVSSALVAELDRQTLTKTDKVELDAVRIGELSQRIKGVGVKSVKGKGSRRGHDDAALARSLAARDPGELRGLAKRLRSDARTKAGKNDFPANEAKALANELDRVAKLPRDTVNVKMTGKLQSQRSRQLREMEDALRKLAKLNPEQIELLMQQTLGLASWRLDAWLTSLTTKRLFDLRAKSPQTETGLQLGAFGWVEDLRRDRRGAKQAHETRSQGFIQTPSLTHAKAAAVLRSGWNAYGSEREASPLAVDLSSERMRFAERAFAAISRGQDPGDLLGREFERTLRHTYGAPEWIYPVRQAVLKMSGDDPDPNLPVVDGLELQRQWLANKERLQKLASEELEKLGGSDKLEFVRVTRAFSKMEERIDALADAGLSEAMFALVQGNVDRAGAQLSAISDGIRGPSDLQILSTAPASITQTHRVVMLPSDSSGWIDDTHAPCPLAAADPTSEAIAAQWIGPPDMLQFQYNLREADGTSRAQGEVHWSDLLQAQSPFGGGALMALKGVPDSGWSQECELAMRLRCYIAARDPALLEGADLHVRPSDETAAKIDQMAAWREVLFGARALHPRDCGAEIDEGTAQLDLGGLEGRAAAAEEAWKSAAKKLTALLPEPEEGDATPVGAATANLVNTAIQKLLAAGWTPALPAFLNPASDRHAAYTAAWSLAAKIRETRAALRELPEPGDDTDAKARRARACLKLLLGANLAYAADFLPADPGGVARAIKAAPTRTQETRIALGGWLEKMAYVRDPLRRLNDAILLAECNQAVPHSADLAVAQWPDGSAHPWIAISPPPERGGSSISWLIAGPVGPVSAKKPLSGIVVDEVIDKIPSANVNTGVALHFDAPNCEAPQTMLLALPPEGEAWSHEVLLDTLGDCFAMARMRPVDSDAMPDFNSILPAIFPDENLKPGGDNG